MHNDKDNTKKLKLHASPLYTTHIPPTPKTVL